MRDIYQVVDGDRLSDLSQGPLEDGSAFVEDLPEDLFKLGVIGDEQRVDLAAGVVQVLTRVISREPKPSRQLAKAVVRVLK